MLRNSFWKFLKFFLTGFTLVLVPVYTEYYGVQNFLWLSDIGLFLTCAGLWLNSTLVMSMAATGMLVVELIWNIDFFAQLAGGHTLIGLARYMFEPTYSLGLRLLSLFHCMLPIVWILYLRQYGYDKRAMYYVTGLYWGVILATYLFTDPEKNINWVFSSYPYGMLLLAIGLPVLIFLPTHYAFTRLFKHNPKL